MSFILYNIETTKLVPTADRWVTSFATISAAKSARTRNKLDKNLYAIADSELFYSSIEKKETRVNLMTKKEFIVGVNTSLATCPSRESHWCA